MLVKICGIDNDLKIANVCMASNEKDYHDNKGRFYVDFSRTPKNGGFYPSLAQTYSVVSQIKWINNYKDGKPTLIHGFIDRPFSIESQYTYRVN